MENQRHKAPPGGKLCFERAMSARRGLFDCLARVADRCDTGTGRHGRRVGKLAGLIAMELGLSRFQANQIAKAAQLHDIGKIRIPEAILRRPGKLTRREYEEAKKHTSVGAEILSGFTFPTLRLASEIARYHHEHWNGRGYIGLSGEAVPLAARITALADSVDAMLHGRPYQDARKLHDVLDIVGQERGEQFDPRIVDAFVGLGAPTLHALSGPLFRESDAQPLFRPAARSHASAEPYSSSTH